MRTELDAQLERLHAAQVQLAALRGTRPTVTAVAEARADADQRARALAHLVPRLRLVR